jgi:hypothetical protein
MKEQVCTGQGVTMKGSESGNGVGELLIGEAAKTIGKSQITLRRLDNKGVIRAKRNYLGQRVFDLGDLLRYFEHSKKLTDPQPETGKT